MAYFSKIIYLLANKLSLDQYSIQRRPSDYTVKTYIHSGLLNISENIIVIAASRTLSVTEITKTVSQVRVCKHTCVRPFDWHIINDISLTQIRTRRAIMFFFVSQNWTHGQVRNEQMWPHTRAHPVGGVESLLNICLVPLRQLMLKLRWTLTVKHIRTGRVAGGKIYNFGHASNTPLLINTTIRASNWTLAHTFWGEKMHVSPFNERVSRRPL